MVVFGLEGTVNVQYEADQSLTMNVNPVPGNKLTACTSVTGDVIMDVSSSGSLFVALRANSVILFEEKLTPLTPVRGRY